MYFDIGTRAPPRASRSPKYRLFSPAANRPANWYENFYLGYTQTSLWDLQSDSMPFIDTTFNPSAFWLSDNLWTSESQNWRLGVGGGTQLNGKDGPDSRSVSDGYIEPRFHYRLDSGSTLTFAPKVKAYFGVASENSDYADYAGRVDWQLRWAQDNGAVISAMPPPGRPAPPHHAAGFRLAVAAHLAEHERLPAPAVFQQLWRDAAGLQPARGLAVPRGPVHRA